jgi:putative photosynthetic complex assembly protein
MSTTPADHLMPRGFVQGGAALIIFALLVTAASSWTEVGTVRLAPVTATESKDLTFELRADGAVHVHDVARSGMMHVVPARGNEGFVKVALQTFIRDRDAAGIKSDLTVRLMRQDDGRMWLEDLTTQRRLTLDAFGSGNAKVFARFFDGKTVDAKLLQERKATP